MADTGAALHPLAPHYIPFYIPGPDGSDQMFVTVTIIVVIGVFFAGALYFWLHSLPENMAHGMNRAQYQLVAILALIGLFTHENLFWIAALLLAAIQLPNLMGPLNSIAGSLAALAGREYVPDNAGDEDEPHPAHTTPAKDTTTGKEA
ncbi:hypothetical protein [Chachezhania antarctica]|uniref:hypothetical protein n=1 Tax=Chachezhania antarctica TaxID=2340860 RepID=UPI000EAF16FE|nr:hypothetical protein [Chachezhania antarctica]|tara:strand:+ start:1858 stop:2301 length:444 start_codon:yes stop_codon:yes gene_type:complete